MPSSGFLVNFFNTKHARKRECFFCLPRRVFVQSGGVQLSGSNGNIRLEVGSEADATRKHI